MVMNLQISKYNQVQLILNFVINKWKLHFFWKMSFCMGKYGIKICFNHQEREMKLQQQGVGIKMDSVLPHLVLVNDDLLSTGIVVYHLKVRYSHDFGR